MFACILGFISVQSDTILPEAYVKAFYKFSL